MNICSIRVIRDQFLISHRFINIIFEAKYLSLMSSLSGWISTNRKTIFWWIVLLILIYFPLFMDLGDLVIRCYDESHMAVISYEMTKDHNWIVQHCNGSIDMINTKPPLMMWAEAILIKLMGMSELTIRLPAAISAAITCIVLMVFSQKFMKNFWAGFAAVLILVTTRGYVAIHGSRTGDYDPIVTLFQTIQALSFFIYIETKKSKYLALSFVGLAFALFTKGVAGAFFLPAMFIYALIKKQVIPILKNYRFYIFLILAFVPVSGYYILREQINPGYIHAVWNNELGGRFLSAMEEHKEKFWFYINNLIDSRYTYWLILLLPGIIIGFISEDLRIRNLTKYLTIIVVVFLLIISSAQTKIYWYDTPLYPLFAIIIGNFFTLFYEFIKPLEQNSFKKFYIVKYGAVISLFIFPYTAILRDSYKPIEPNVHEWLYYHAEYYMQKATRGEKDLNNTAYYYTNYEVPVLFYRDMLRDKGQNMKWVKKPDFNPGEKVLISQDIDKDSVKAKYTYQVIDSDCNVLKLQILARKK